ncbi:MAG TPA: helix-turn-helix transcriptional regulator [Gammaproteobacteria bacterium]|nr:helix-turn-helix transcriptional regulator [Gammaproteobacteria bacterium]
METQRRQLIDFLKGCRARLAPEQVGLPDTSRRRTPGLRREDVAALAGVSVTWYTWLEQGRDIQVSVHVLERICSTLRMTPDEREYLFALAQRRPPPRARTRSDEVSPTLARMLEALAVPALVMTLRWDVIAWNRLTTKIFRDYDKLPLERRNLLRILLVDDEAYQRDPIAYEATARRILSKFRVDYSQVPTEPEFEELIAELAARCPIFRRLWNSPEVLGRSEAVAHHPQLGGITFEHSSYVPEGSPTLRLVVFVPYDEESAAKVAALLADEKPVAAPGRPAAKPN